MVSSRPARLDNPIPDPCLSSLTQAARSVGKGVVRAVVPADVCANGVGRPDNAARPDQQQCGSISGDGSPGFMTNSVRLASNTDAGKMKPRLLLLTHYYPAHRGGVEIVAGQLAFRLAEQYEILWLAADCDPAPVLPGIRCEPQGVWNKLETKG